MCVRGVIKEGEMRRSGEEEEGRVEKKQKERKETKKSPLFCGEEELSPRLPLCHIFTSTSLSL